MTQISSYFARVAVESDRSSFQKIDKLFDSLEKRINRFANVTKGVQVTIKPRINVGESAKYIQRIMTLAGRDVTIPLRKFTINSKDLASQISNSLSTKSGANRIRLNATLSPQSLQAMRQQVQTALSGMIISPRIRPITSPLNTPRSPANARGNGVVAGNSATASGGLGWLGRGALGLLPAFGAAAAFSGINNATKNATLSDMTSKGIFTEAVQPDGSVRNVYENSNAWIRKHAYDTGASLPNILPSYQTFMAGAGPTMGYEPSQDIFKAFSQFGTVRGASKESMQRALTAVSQIAGKGQLYAEEVKGQLAEAQGFGELPQIIAAAYQTKTDGKKVGSEAYSALLDAMKKGDVKSDILLEVAKILRQRSDPYISAAANTASGWQNRAETSRFNFTSQFAANGGDKGLATIWQTIAEMSDRAGINAANLGKYFQIGSLYASDLLLYIEDIGKVLTNQAKEDGPFAKLFGMDTVDNVNATRLAVLGFISAVTQIGTSSSIMENTKQQWRDISNIITIAAQSALALAQLGKGDFKGAWSTFSDNGLRIYDLMGGAKYTMPSEMVGVPTVNPPAGGGRGFWNPPAATTYSPVNTPSTFQSSITSVAPVINIWNPTVTAAPGTTVPQAFADMTSGALQDSLSQSLKGALAKFPKTPQ